MSSTNAKSGIPVKKNVSQTKQMPDFSKLHKGWQQKLEQGKACKKKPCTVPLEFEFSKKGPQTRSQAAAAQRVMKAAPQKKQEQATLTPPELGVDFEVDDRALQSILTNTGLAMAAPLQRQTVAAVGFKTPTRAPHRNKIATEMRKSIYYTGPKPGDPSRQAIYTEYTKRLASRLANEVTAGSSPSLAKPTDTNAGVPASLRTHVVPQRQSIYCRVIPRNKLFPCGGKDTATETTQKPPNPTASTHKAQRVLKNLPEQSPAFRVARSSPAISPALRQSVTGTATRKYLSMRDYLNQPTTPYKDPVATLNFANEDDQPRASRVRVQEEGSEVNQLKDLEEVEKTLRQEIEEIELRKQKKRQQKAKEGVASPPWVAEVEAPVDLQSLEDAEKDLEADARQMEKKSKKPRAPLMPLNEKEIQRRGPAQSQSEIYCDEESSFTSPSKPRTSPTSPLRALSPNISLEKQRSPRSPKVIPRSPKVKGSPLLARVMAKSQMRMGSPLISDQAMYSVLDMSDKENISPSLSRSPLTLEKKDGSYTVDSAKDESFLYKDLLNCTLEDVNRSLSESVYQCERLESQVLNLSISQGLDVMARQDNPEQFQIMKQLSVIKRKQKELQKMQEMLKKQLVGDSSSSSKKARKNRRTPRSQTKLMPTRSGSHEETSDTLPSAGGMVRTALFSEKSPNVAVNTPAGQGGEAGSAEVIGSSHTSPGSAVLSHAVERSVRFTLPTNKENAEEAKLVSSGLTDGPRCHVNSLGSVDTSRGASGEETTKLTRRKSPPGSGSNGAHGFTESRAPSSPPPTAARTVGGELPMRSPLSVFSPRSFMSGSAQVLTTPERFSAMQTTMVLRSMAQSLPKSEAGSAIPSSLWSAYRVPGRDVFLSDSTRSVSSTSNVSSIQNDLLDLSNGSGISSGDYSSTSPSSSSGSNFSPELSFTYVDNKYTPTAQKTHESSHVTSEIKSPLNHATESGRAVNSSTAASGSPGSLSLVANLARQPAGIHKPVPRRLSRASPSPTAANPPPSSVRCEVFVDPKALLLAETRQRYDDALLDEEVTRYACRLRAFVGLAGVRNFHDRCSNPVGRILREGDDMHFVPIHEESGMSAGAAAASSSLWPQRCF